MRMIKFLDMLSNKLTIPTIIFTVFILVLKSELMELGVFTIYAYIALCLSSFIGVSAIAGYLKNKKSNK